MPLTKPNQELQHDLKDAAVRLGPAQIDLGGQAQWSDDADWLTQPSDEGPLNNLGDISCSKAFLVRQARQVTTEALFLWQLICRDRLKKFRWGGVFSFEYLYLNKNHPRIYRP